MTNNFVVSLLRMEIIIKAKLFKTESAIDNIKYETGNEIYDTAELLNYGSNR